MSAVSARGLFRATGNKTKPVAIQMLDGTFAKSDSGLEREKDDFYPTPPEPTRAFLHAEIDRLRDFDGIWEPAAGDGAMAREIETLGIEVVMSDLVDRGAGATIRDFYDFTEPSAKAIVTNGLHQRCTSHLNLTVSLADIDRRSKTILPAVKAAAARPPVRRPPYAGYDPTERQW